MKQRANLLQGQGIIAALFLSLLLAACGAGDEQKKPAAATAPPPAEVDVIIATPAAAVLTQDLPGRLQAYRSAQVRARVEGIIERRKFTEGSDVVAGVALYQIAFTIIRRPMMRQKPMPKSRARHWRAIKS